MRVVSVVTAVLVVVGMPVESSAQYVWTISASATNAFMNTTSAGSLTTFYLWYLNSCVPSADGGLSTAEFRIDSSGPSIVAFTPQNGFMNAGGTQSVSSGPPPSKGDICHIDWFCLYCHPVIGCDLEFQGTPCSPDDNCDDCPPTSVETRSWGSAKAKYRD